ncbi:MAG TPA: hypothetical protein V6D20_05155 [Candidatus Obscuribacterales bacterium]
MGLVGLYLQAHRGHMALSMGIGREVSDIDVYHISDELLVRRTSVCRCDRTFCER